jgi:serine/threonine protein kinase
MTTLPTANAKPRSTVRPLPLVAIKVQRRKYASQAVDESTLHRQIDRSQPGSRYVVRMFETCVHEGHVCQVFEKCGQALSKCLRRQSFTEAEVKRIARQVLEALCVLHDQGLAHTDIKPENLLWNRRTRETRLIDLGSAERQIETGDAIATREYSPPEMLVGTPMGPSVDLWSLGCTLFELITGEVLFDPWSVCQAKYVEFGAGEDEDGDEEEDDDDEDEEEDEDDGDEEEEVNLDEQDEEAEQLTPGTVIQGKYELLRRLGSGKFGTVWEARPSHSEPLAAELPTKAEARLMSAAARRPEVPTAGQYCVYELALNYEHFVLMQRRLGLFPDHLARSGRFSHLLYDETGALRFQPELEPVPLWQDLIAGGKLTADQARAAEAFLKALLQLDPERRVTAREALDLPWLAESV